VFGLGSQELLVIMVIVVILFGANRLPQIARSLGSSMKEFKKGRATLPVLPQSSRRGLEPLPTLWDTSRAGAGNTSQGIARWSR